MNHLRRITLSSMRKTKNVRMSSNIYEPDYLESLKPKVPLYDTVNVQIRGYDFAVLENFQGFIHSLARNMEIDVDDSWGVPPQHMQVTTYKPASDIINSQYKLKIFERTVQVTDVPSTLLPILLRAIEASTPAGVSVQAMNHEEYHEEIRYVPDKELITLKQELDDMGGPAKKKF